MQKLPDQSHSFAYDQLHGKRAEAWENASDSAYDELLIQLANEHKPKVAGLTAGQKAIWELLIDEDLDGTVFAAVHAAASHLANRTAISPEQVGQALIDALRKDLSAVAERRAGAEV